MVICAFPPLGGDPVTESTPATEDFPYAHSKRISEDLCRDYAPFFKIVIFRMRAVYSDWCEYPPLYMFLKTWFSKNWNARILDGKGNSAIPYIHMQDRNNFLFRILDRCDRLEDCVVLPASPDRVESHHELFDASTRHFFGRSVRPVFMPRALAAVGIVLRF